MSQKIHRSALDASANTRARLRPATDSELRADLAAILKSFQKRLDNNEANMLTEEDSLQAVQQSRERTLKLKDEAKILLASVSAK